MSTNISHLKMSFGNSLATYISHTTQFTHLRCTVYYIHSILQLSPQLLLKHLITRKGTACPAVIIPPFATALQSSPRQSLIYSQFPQIWTFGINGILKCVVFCGQFLLLSIMLSRFIHAVAYISFHFFSLLNNVMLLYVYATLCFSIRQLDCIHFSTVMNSAYMNIIYEFFEYPFSFLLSTYIQEQNCSII